MEAQVDPKLLRSISTTKKQLGKHITKPVLADKYLGRPPFRFLLEIVNNVIQQTSFMKDTFTAKELKYDEISSPEDKRAVLKKVIDAIEQETGEKCSARTSKILSGKEPEKTNEMLQLLAKAISSYSRKQKQKPEESKISEKPSTSVIEDDGTKEKARDSSCNRENSNNKEANKEIPTSSKKLDPGKSRPSAGAPSHPVGKKSSTTGPSVKTKPPGDKTNLSVKSKALAGTVKKTATSSSSKVASKEALKTKVGSPSPSSLAVVPPKKVSSSNLAKSNSRQSLKSSVKEVSSEPLKASGKKEEAILQISRSADKLQQKSEEVSASVRTTAAMPPETTAEVPLQRPVTRTKYRQKTSEGEGEAGVIGEDELVTLTPASDELPASTELVKDNVEQLDHSIKDSVGCGVKSGRSSSSEEVVTEHMNEKISEWRATSAETMQQAESEPAPQHFHRTGWITDEPENIPDPGRTKSPMNRVFDSVENCTTENENYNRSDEGQNETLPRAHSTAMIAGEDRNHKVLKRPVTVLRDNESGDEEDDTFLVQEKIESERDMALDRLQQNTTLMNNRNSTSTDAVLEMAYLPTEHCGLLVNQIIETQRELEKLARGQHTNHHRHLPGSLIENDLAERDKAAIREVYMKQAEDLKGAIQKMSKCANPLANIIQRSQDDACLMEIEFRKLRQENERLQKKIYEAEGETSRILYPLTEELAQLDSRIEKVEGAVVLAKQRLSLIDSEYATELIAQLENTPTEDETQAEKLESDPIWQFRGNFAGKDDDEDENGGIQNKSLIDVFKRAVNMHEGLSWNDDTNRRVENFRSKVVPNPVDPSIMLSTGSPGRPTFPKCERRLLNRTVFGDDSPLGRRSNRILRQLEREESPVVDKENKPSWWD